MTAHDKYSAVIFGKRHFRVDYVDFADRRVFASNWHVVDHEDAYEAIERHAEVIANREGREVDIVICGSREGIRVRPAVG